MNLSGVEIIGRWRNDKDGTIFSIAELDLEQVKRTTSTVDDMNTDLKRYITNHSNNIFDQVSQEKK